MQPTREDFGLYRNMILKIAVKIMRRSGAVQNGLTVEDLLQEGYLVFLKCVEKFKPDAGVKFSTYLYTAATNRFTTMATPSRVQTDSIDAARGEGLSLLDTIGDDGVSAAKRYERISEARANVAKLSPAARGVVAAWMNPPATLEQELRRARAFRCSNGKVNGNVKMNPSFVMKAMGYGETARNRVANELRLLSKGKL